MKTNRVRFWVIGIIIVILIITGSVFHAFQNRPYGVVGYFTHQAGVYDIGKHFRNNEELIARFYYNLPSSKKDYTYRFAYTLWNRTTGKVVLKDVSLMKMNGQSTNSYRTYTDIPIAESPNELKLNTGEYEVDLLINSRQLASTIFYVDAPIVVYPAG